MGKKSTPKPPDLTPLSDAQLEISRQQLAQAQQQMNLSQSQFETFMKLSQDELKQSNDQYNTQMGLQSRALDQADAANAVAKTVADKQLQSMDQSMQYAAEDRARYTGTILPLQDQYIAAAESYASPEKQAAEAAKALADNQTQIEAQRNNQMAALTSMGIDPSQVMSSSLSSQLGVAGAAAGALSANNARENTIQTGYNMLGNAINMGNNLPAQQVANSAGATNAGNSAAGNMASGANTYANASQIGATASGIRQNSLNTASNLTGSPMSWAQLGNQSYGGASNGIMNAGSLQNQMFQNQMSAQQMKNDQANSTMSAIGSVAGMAAMAFMAEGGVVGRDGYSDLPRIDAPAYTVNVADIPQRVSPITEAPELTPRFSTGQQAGAMMAANMLSRPQPQQYNPDSQQQFLKPIYRAEGGAMGQSRVMPSVQSRDLIHTMLAPGEYVVPADVVRQLGSQHFDKLVAKHHRPGA